MEMRSHLSRARGLGSTYEGVHHWRLQRISGIALLPLALWFVFSIIGLIGADLITVKAWVGAYGNPVLLSLLTISMFHHAQLGLQVVIEDYVHSETAKSSSLFIIKAIAVLCGTSCIFAIIRLTFEATI